MSGRPHRIEIWFAYAPPTIYLLSGGGDRSDWVRNLQHDPAVIVTAAGTDYTASARVIDDTDEQRVARDLVYAKYQPTYGGDLSSWREASLPIAIEADQASP